MSYCRFSSLNWRCDLYCYEDANGGWTTHVASNRIVGEPPHNPDMDTVTVETAAQFAREMNANHQWLMTCERTPIALPHAGSTFNDATLADFKARLIELRAIGYRFPDDVIATIDEEIGDG